MSNSFDYTVNDIKNALKKTGLKNKDNIFLHSNLGFFGKLKDINKKYHFVETFYNEIRNIIGKDGSLIVPTFTYSFFNKKPFFKKKTPSVMGIFSEHVRKKKEAIRSNDPNFSISCIGPLSEKFRYNTDYNSYSEKSFFSLFHKINGKILNFNFPGSTIIHYYEKLLKVSYRFDKTFSGYNNGKFEKWVVFSKYLGKKNTYHNPFPITKLIEKSKATKVASLGKGKILCITSKQFYDCIKKEIKLNKFLLTLGNKKNY